MRGQCYLVHVAGVESVLAAQQVDGELRGGAANHLRLPLPAMREQTFLANDK